MKFGGVDDQEPQETQDQSGVGGKQISDPLLKRAEMAIEQKLTPENLPNYKKIVTAGMKVALQNGTQGLLGQLMQAQDIADTAAKGAVALIGHMAKASRGTMPPKAAVPAAATLMILALDTAERAGAIKVDENTLAEAMKKLTDYLFQMFKVSNADLNKGAEMAHTVSQNPRLMQAVQMHAGVIKHPMAVVNTEVPPSPSEEQ